MRGGAAPRRPVPGDEPLAPGEELFLPGGEEVLVSDEEYRRLPEGAEAAALTAAGGAFRVKVYDPTVIRLWEDLLRTRNVYVFGDIDPESAARFVQQLHWLDGRGDAPIVVHISSPGGDVLPGIAMVDAIRQARSPVTTVGYGYVASMASVILQAGRVRRMTGRSWLLIHEIERLEKERTTTSESKEDIAWTERIQQQMLDLYAERSKVSREEMQRKWKFKNWVLDATEALHLGFIDEIEAGTQAPPTAQTPRKPRAPRKKKPEPEAPAPAGEPKEAAP